MLTEEEVSTLRNLLTYIRSQGKASIDTCEKLQVALSNILRLVDIQDSTLSRLQGSGDDLRGYLVRLTSDMCQSNQNTLEHIVDTLEGVLKSID